jgi:hypothetical protein
VEGIDDGQQEKLSVATTFLYLNTKHNKTHSAQITTQKPLYLYLLFRANLQEQQEQKTAEVTTPTFSGCPSIKHEQCLILS